VFNAEMLILLSSQALNAIQSGQN